MERVVERGKFQGRKETSDRKRRRANVWYGSEEENATWKIRALILVEVE